MKYVAKALIIDKNGDILVLRRSKTHPKYPHHYDFPGGEVDDNEKQNDAVVREIFEETGIAINPDSIQQVYQSQPTDKNVVHVLYQTTVTKHPIITLSYEHDSSIWLSPTEITLTRYAPNLDRCYLDYLEYISQLATY